MYFSYTKYRTFYTADFETSTHAWNVDKARVWLWDICDKNLKHKNGTTIESFIKEISKYNDCLFSFHNLAYDGSYLLSKIIEMGFVFVNEDKLRKGQFTTIISPQGQHYCYQICFPNGNTVTINDSLKHNSASVKDLAEIYKLPIQKGHIDYDLYRDENHVPTDEELIYIHYDTEIMMMILKEDIDNGFTEFTESGNSKKFFKKSRWKNKEDYLITFPILSDSEDAFVRHAYRGGYCYLKEEHFNKIQGKMISIDINSMYPAQMLHKPLPYGEGISCVGFAEKSEEYKQLLHHNPVYVQHLYASFRLKQNHVPTIARKSFNSFSIKDLYLKDSGLKICEMWLTSVDLKLFFENYNVWNLEYVDAFIYKTQCGQEVDKEKAKTMTVDEIIKEDGIGSFYYDYLYPWRLQKEHEKGGKRNRAKKQQNIGYGWQATSKDSTLCRPVLKDGILSYVRYSGNARKGGYLPVAAFITAYSREYIITSILNNYDRFVYCDTDSMYLLGQETPNVPIHDSLYGYFKIEHYIKKAKFLGCKRYMYETEEYSNEPNQLIVKCCGAPTSVTQQMTFDNFIPYNKDTGDGEFKGKIASRMVVGGKHLLETTYRLVC